MAGKTTKKTTSVDTKVEAVRRFFADSKPENHPIKEHPVTKQEEYVRDLYLEMLCVMAQYESSNTENAFTLIKRIMAVCKETQPLDEYIKRSMELTPERAAEFVRQCKDNRLCEIFMVDSMLLSCANGEPNAKQVAFVTEFGDMLGFDRERMKDMSSFTLAILMQDFEMLANTAKNNIDNRLNLNLILCYLNPIISSMVNLNGKELYYYSLFPMRFHTYCDEWICLLEYEEYDEDKYNEEFSYLKGLELDKVWDGDRIKNRKSIVFRNYIFTHPFEFISVDKVTFIDCVFSGGKDSYVRKMTFSGVKTVEFHNCIMKEIKGHLLKIADTASSVIMKNCSVTDCDYLIADDKGSTISMYDCVFSKMYAGNGYHTGAGPAICYHGETPNIYLENCDFYDCRGSYLFYAPFGWDGQKHINLKEKNNHYDNCCPIARNY